MNTDVEQSSFQFVLDHMPSSDDVEVLPIPKIDSQQLQEILDLLNQTQPPQPKRKPHPHQGHWSGCPGPTKNRRYRQTS
jgi:hypothetical protein